MEQKIIFRQLLDELKEQAAINENRLTRADVEQYLEHVGLSAEQVDMVCAYLKDQKITVEDFVDTRSAEQTGEYAPEVKEEKPVQQAADPEDEQISSLQIYLEELGEIGQISPAEQLALFHKAAEGDAAAKAALTESFLPVICDMAGEMNPENMLVEDLIQEGNMGLILALENLEKMDSLAAYQAVVMNEVNKYLEEVCGASSDDRNLNKDMLDRVKKLNDIIEQLEKELERKVTAEELSAYLEIPVDEIRDILRLSGDHEE